MIIDATQTETSHILGTTNFPKRIFRLKDASIVATFGFTCHVLVRDGLYFGAESYYNRIWVLGANVVYSACQNVHLDKDDVDYELRFRPGDLVQNKCGDTLKISSIPANCGGYDYGGWRLQDNGKFSSSIGINDLGLAAGLFSPGSRARTKEHKNE